MASANVGLPMTSCHALMGNWLVIMVEPRSYRSSTISIRSRRCVAVIPTCTDQHSCAHLRIPMDLVRAGWLISLFQASQQ